MPLKASIGVARKVGQPDYGSLGANCQLEVELDASLVGDAEAFHEKIQRLYALANQSVNDQLDRQTNGSGPIPADDRSDRSPQGAGRSQSRPIW